MATGCRHCESPTCGLLRPDLIVTRRLCLRPRANILCEPRTQKHRSHDAIVIAKVLMDYSAQGLSGAGALDVMASFDVRSTNIRWEVTLGTRVNSLAVRVTRDVTDTLDLSRSLRHPARLMRQQTRRQRERCLQPKTF